MAKTIAQLFKLSLKDKTLPQEATVEEAIRRLNETGARSLLIQDKQGRGIGVLSEHDLVRAFTEEGDSVKTKPISEFMSLDLVVAEDGADIDHVMKLMAEHNVRHMPVISALGNVVSFLSIMQILMAKISDKDEEA